MKTLTKLNETAVFPKVFHKETVAMTDTRKVSQFLVSSIKRFAHY